MNAEAWVEQWDVVVIGTGFGGAMAASKLADGNRRVLLLERGPWVARDASAWDPGEILVRRRYAFPQAIDVEDDTGRREMVSNAAVGGASVFYGAASLRLRLGDFRMASRLGPDAGAGLSWTDWPIGYEELSPYYDEAERLLGVLGVRGADPTEPPRSCDFVAPPPPFSTPARTIAEAASALGLRPFPLPLAINLDSRGGRTPCELCLTCDQFPCRISAKNDLAVTVLPDAQARGAAILPGVLARRIVRRGDRATGVECSEIATGRTITIRCRVCVVACGAIDSAALLLRSGIAEASAGGHWIGRHLQRHCSGVVAGVFRGRTNPERRFHKQVAIADFYDGGPAGRRPAGPWGLMQGLQVPPAEYVHAEAPLGVRHVAAATLGRSIYLLCIAHDRPNPDNRVSLSPARDAFGLARARVFHRYAKADLAARKALMREAVRVLRAAGSLVAANHRIPTFSHAVGTARFGTDPAHAALDPDCRVFGLRNLFVSDGSFMPTCGAVNPSLTIAANALRVGARIAAEWSALT